MQTTAIVPISPSTSLFPPLFIRLWSSSSFPPFLRLHLLSRTCPRARPCQATPLSSNILFLAMFHSPLCAMKPPCSNYSLNLLHYFLETLLLSPSTFHPFCIPVRDLSSPSTLRKIFAISQYSSCPSFLVCSGSSTSAPNGIEDETNTSCNRQEPRHVGQHSLPCSPLVMADFGQSNFGQSIFAQPIWSACCGQSIFGQSVFVLLLWLFVVVCGCCWFGPSPGPPCAGPPCAGPPPPRPPPCTRPPCTGPLRRRTPPSPDRPKFRSFFLSRSHFRSSCFSLGVFSLSFGVFLKAGTLKCARLDHGRLQTPPKFHEKTPKRGKKDKSEVAVAKHPGGFDGLPVHSWVQTFTNECRAVAHMHDWSQLVGVHKRRTGLPERRRKARTRWQGCGRVGQIVFAHDQRSSS